MQWRLDAVLVENGLVKSRERAKEIIKKNGVTVNRKIVSKPSFSVSECDDIKVIIETLRYVSRGGLKLEKAIQVFDLDFSESVCVDLGASTGGFVDCMLQNGAKKVYAVDVGHDQLDKSLLDNPKVLNLEGVNVKSFSTEYTKEKVDFVTADLSFISIKSSLGVIRELLKDNALAVILIKPQFEVGKSKIGKGGIVKDKSAHIELLTELLPFIEENKMSVEGLTVSSIKGGDGNIEYLALLKNKVSDKSFLATFDVKKFVNDSFMAMK